MTPKKKKTFPYKGNLEPRWENIRLLAQPSKKHKTVQGIALPRLNPNYHNEERREARKRAGNHCEICSQYLSGDPSTNQAFRYLEDWKIDEQAKIYHLIGYYAVCLHCWLFMNPSVVTKMIENYEMNRKQAREFYTKRLGYLRQVGLQPAKITNRNAVYCVSYKGRKYINDSRSDLVAFAHSRGVGIVHLPYMPVWFAIDVYHNTWDF